MDSFCRVWLGEEEVAHLFSYIQQAANLPNERQRNEPRANYTFLMKAKEASTLSAAIRVWRGALNTLTGILLIIQDFHHQRFDT